MNDDYQIGSDNWPGLAKLVEESGELMQVLGKLMATGGVRDHWDGTDLEDRLYEELGDLHGTMLFFVHTNKLDSARINKRADNKIELFESWRRQ